MTKIPKPKDNTISKPVSPNEPGVPSVPAPYNEKEPPSESRAPSEMEKIWFDYVDKLPFHSDEYLTKFSDKLLSLNTAVIGSYIAGIKLLSITLEVVLWLPLSLFLLSLFTSLYSIFPRKVDARYETLEDIQDNYIRGLKKRKIAISLGFISFFLGILSAITVLLV